MKKNVDSLLGQTNGQWNVNLNFCAKMIVLLL